MAKFLNIFREDCSRTGDTLLQSWPKFWQICHNTAFQTQDPALKLISFSMLHDPNSPLPTHSSSSLANNLRCFQTVFPNTRIHCLENFRALNLLLSIVTIKNTLPSTSPLPSHDYHWELLLRFFPLSIVQPKLHTQLNIKTIFTRRTDGRGVETYNFSVFKE